MVICGEYKLQSSLAVFLLITCISAVIYILLGGIMQQVTVTDHMTKVSDTGGMSEKPVPEAVLKNHQEVLGRLGFVRTPTLYPQPHHPSESKLPVFILALGLGQVEDFYKFIASMRMYYAEKKLVIYDLGMSKEEAHWVRVTCQCVLRTFHWDWYPRHVSDVTSEAYKPIIIQDALQEFGIILWCSPRMRFTSPQLDPIMAVAKQYGLAAWVRQDYPTSSLTHPGTFRYLTSRPSDYHFHHMAETDPAIFVNYNTIHGSLMLGWVACALESACVAPPGAQPAGCNYQRRPKFAYAGCHRYAASAFNVLLGRMFGYETPYVTSHSVHSMTSQSPGEEREAAKAVNTSWVKRLFHQIRS